MSHTRTREISWRLRDAPLTSRIARTAALSLVALLAACSSEDSAGTPTGDVPDASGSDGSSPDASTPDASTPDASTADGSGPDSTDDAAPDVSKPDGSGPNGDGVTSPKANGRFNWDAPIANIHAWLEANQDRDDLPPVLVDSPPLTNPTVEVLGSGSFNQTYADDQDVILYLPPGTHRTGEISINGGRHIRLVGGFSQNRMILKDVSGSLYVEGVYNKMAPDTNRPDSFWLASRPTTRYYFQNCEFSGHRGYQAGRHGEAAQWSGQKLESILFYNNTIRTDHKAVNIDLDPGAANQVLLARTVALNDGVGLQLGDPYDDGLGTFGYLTGGIGHLFLSNVLLVSSNRRGIDKLVAASFLPGNGRGAEHATYPYPGPGQGHSIQRVLWNGDNPPVSGYLWDAEAAGVDYGASNRPNSATHEFVTGCADGCAPDTPGDGYRSVHGHADREL